VSSGTVNVIDDDDDLRETLAGALRSKGYYALTYGSVEHFIHNHVPAVPEVILVDMRMPVQSGLDLLKTVQQNDLSIPVIFISGESTAPEAVEAMKIGAADFIFKPAPLSKILSAVEYAMTRHLAKTEELKASQRFLTRYATLTPRERELCPYIGRDEKIKTIAAALNITQPTVKIHKSRVLKKLGVTTSAELALKLAKYVPSRGEPTEYNS